MPSQFSTCRPDHFVLARGTKAEVHQKHSVLIAAESRLFGRLSNDVRRRGERDADFRLLIARRLHTPFQRLQLLCKPRPLRKQTSVEPV